MKNLLFLVLAVGLFSCGNNSNSEGENTSEAAVEEVIETPELPAEMIKRDWVLMNYEEEGKNYKVQGDTEVTIKFNPARCFGIGGCNNYGANFTLTGENGIEFGEIGATKKICNSIMGQEIKYFKLLKESTSYEYKDAVLTLNGPNGKLNFRYKPAAPKE